MNPDHLIALADSLRAMAEQLRHAPAAAPVRNPTEPEFKIHQVAPYVTLEKAAQVTGYSKRAIEEKIAKGVWLKGREWTHAPDGRRLISMEGYRRWAEQNRDKKPRQLST